MTLNTSKARWQFVFCLTHELIMNIQHFPCTGAYAQSTLCKSSIDLCLDTLTSYNEQKCK